MYHEDWNSEATKKLDGDSTQEDDDYDGTFDRTDESDDKMWGEIEYRNMEWQHREGYFNVLLDDSELEGSLTKDVQSKGEKGANVINGKSKLQPINRKQLQAAVKGKGQQPSSNIFTAQCSQGCHLLSRLGGAIPSTSINEEYFHLQSVVGKSNDIIYATSK
jgi:hypothetical protein